MEVLENLTLHFENDSLPGGGSDDSYTQGMELRVGLDGEETWKILPVNWIWRVRGERPFNGRNLVVGQTIVTPNNIITYFPRGDDRPFGALLYVGAESVRVREANVHKTDGKVLMPRRVIFGFTAGLIGPAALGRQMQSAYHILRQNRMAKGWLVSQSPHRPELNFRLTNEHVVLSTAEAYEKANQATEESFLKKWGSFFDLTLAEEGVLGTTQQYAGIGGTVRLGRGLSGLPGTIMPIRVTRRARRRRDRRSRRRRVRVMGRNAFVSGPLFASNGRDTEHFLKEWHFGGEVRVHEWRISYVVVTQGREMKTRTPRCRRSTGSRP